MEEDFDTNYPLYLKSKEWKQKHAAVVERTPICGDCDRQRKSTRVFHKNYVNMGNEHIEDLYACCGYCYRHYNDMPQIALKIRFENRKFIDQLMTLFGEPTMLYFEDEDMAAKTDSEPNTLHFVWQGMGYYIMQLSVDIDTDNNIGIWCQKHPPPEIYSNLDATKAMNHITKLIN